jgi:hypothetical protein
LLNFAHFSSFSLIFSLIFAVFFPPRYRRGVWTDARTVNVIASACLSSEPRLIVACLKFFLGVDGENADDDEDDDEVDPQVGAWGPAFFFGGCFAF